MFDPPRDYVASLTEENAGGWIAHLFGVRVCAQAGVEYLRTRIPGAPLRLEEALGLGEYQDAAPVQIGLQPGGAGNRAYLE